MPDPNYYYTLSPSQLLAVVGYKEARGEGEPGILAVMHVIYNRMRAWRQTIQHVILGPNQFTSMTDSADPEFELMSSPGDPAFSDPVYKSCLTDAGSILNGTNEDETLGACYYANLANIQPGGWFERFIVNDPARHPLLVKIGNQSFFR